MVAGLLYLIGLVAALVTIVLVGYSAPAVIQSFNAAMALPDANLVTTIGDAARSLSWAVWPLLGGLLLMGFGRLILLLAAINRALRGAP